MNYLLDTHAFIWAISEKSKLSQQVRLTLENPANTIYVSAVTFWEISLKFSIGKLNIDGISPEALPELALQLGFELLPLSAAEATNHHKLPLTNHKDPFDRMLIWQSISKNLIFISKDSRLADYDFSGLKSLW
jgi:PIN domain nuclease of toxin-antitoxin system